MSAETLIALCQKWHLLKNQMEAAYQAIPEELGDANARAQDQADELCNQASDLFDSIALVAPTSAAEMAAQASVAMAEMVQTYSAPPDDPEVEPTFTDRSMCGIYRILRHIAGNKFLEVPRSEVDLGGAS